MPINVRIVQLGKGVFQYAGATGATVETGLTAAEVPTSGMEVRVNGRPASGQQPLQDGDLVTVIPLIKGGHLAGTPTSGTRVLSRLTGPGSL